MAKTRYSIDLARFVPHGEQDVLGPVVIWVAVYPGSISADTAHDVSQDILELLERNGVEGVEVEWREAVTEKAVGPALLTVKDDLNPTVDVCRHLTPVIGLPISAAEREKDDAHGTVGFFFHENRDQEGNLSDKVFAVTNYHVLRKEYHKDHEPKGARRCAVRASGLRRIQMGLDEITYAVSSRTINAEHHTRVIIELETKVPSQDEGAQEESELLQRYRSELKRAERAIGALEQFYKVLLAQWGDISRRNIGYVHFCPAVSVDAYGERFTEDWGTIELLESKFKEHFSGNVVDLGDIPPYDLQRMIQDDGWLGFEVPVFRQFRISGIVTREQLANPEFESEDQTNFTVLKHGCATKLTVGRYAGLESYVCDEDGVESVELAIYNYCRYNHGQHEYRQWSGPFAAKGDSGSLIFDSRGRMVGLLHSVKSTSGELCDPHVTYASPAWWLIKRIKEKYPHAYFERTAW